MGQAAEKQMMTVKEERSLLASRLQNKGFTRQDVETGGNHVVGKGYVCVRKIMNQLSPEEQLLLEMSFCELYDIDVRL